MKLKTEKVEKINESWTFKKINKIDRLPARLTEKKRENLQNTEVENESGNIATDPADIKSIIKEYWGIFQDDFRVTGSSIHLLLDQTTLAAKLQNTQLQKPVEV